MKKQLLLILFLSITPVFSCFGMESQEPLDDGSEEATEEQLTEFLSAMATAVGNTLPTQIAKVKKDITTDIKNVREEINAMKLEQEKRDEARERRKDMLRIFKYSLLLTLTITSWMSTNKELKSKETKLKTVLKDFFTPSKFEKTCEEYPQTSFAIIETIVFGIIAAIDIGKGHGNLRGLSG